MLATATTRIFSRVSPSASQVGVNWKRSIAAIWRNMSIRNSGAQASFSAVDVVYRVRIRHVMAWLYGNIGTRTDWYFGTS